MTITTEEMERLRVRLADLPGFDAGDEEWETASRRFARHCMRQLALNHGLDEPDDYELIAINDAFDDALPEREYVSTADARTRDALARWVAERVNVSIGCTIAPGFYWWDHDLSEGEEPAWILQSIEPEARGYHGWTRARVLGLDPTDDRLLPDGSRWVDAAALAAVVRHVGGQP